MTCPTCRNPIPNEKFACPRCLEEKSKQAVREYQLHGLRKVYAGEADLTTRAIKGKRHVQMFVYGDRAFCWTPVTTHDRKDHITWDEDQLKTICAECRKELMRLMKIAVSLAPADEVR